MVDFFLELVEFFPSYILSFSFIQFLVLLFIQFLLLLFILFRLLLFIQFLLLLFILFRLLLFVLSIWWFLLCLFCVFGQKQILFWWPSSKSYLEISVLIRILWQVLQTILLSGKKIFSSSSPVNSILLKLSMALFLIYFYLI